MPGTNLTRDEAATRGALLAVDSYTVDLDLTVSDKVFESTTVISFTCAQPGSETFADLHGATIHEITLNGEALDVFEHYRDNRITLRDLRAENELRVHCELPYSHTGEGLHRFVDPADQRVYLYTQFEVPDARRMYTTFEQPDLKSVFTFSVTAPAHWEVISNAPTPAPEDLGAGKGLWRFPTTERMSTYITALVAGEYHRVDDVYEGKHGTIALGHFCRQSLVEHLDHEALNKVTKQGFAFFEEAFDYPYPFGKYDQAYVPEYNMGAMENAGCVTYRDEYLPRSRQTHSFYEQRANTVLHEMAHMWFGDLVTMRWWDDLWLNESFAEWASHHAMTEATEYTDAWTGFTNARKNWAYRQDQLPSTHPIAADNFDLEAVEVNFDGITYAKGASTLKQLVAWVGIEEFTAGLRDYFKTHEFANSEFSDLLASLEKASGRELDSWAREWLQTSGVNTLAPVFEVDENGAFTSFAVAQTAAPEFPTIRRHRIAVGLYDVEGDRVVRRSSLEIDVIGDLTEVRRPGRRAAARPGAPQRRRPHLRQDPPRRALAGDGRGQHRQGRRLARPGAALGCCLGHDPGRRDERAGLRGPRAARHRRRDRPDRGEPLRHVRAHRGRVLLRPRHPAELRATWERGVREMLLAAEPGSDHQLSFARAYASAAHSDEALDLLAGLLDGTETLDGLTVDADLRWTLLTGLAGSGRADEARIEEELARDNTISGQEHAAMALTVRPTAEAKAQAWRDAIERDDVANETMRQIAYAFPTAGQEELLAPYLEKYLAMAETVWDEKGTQRASTVLEYMFPKPLTSPETLDRLDAWLEVSEANPAAKRYVREGRSDMARALAAQARDAR